MIIGIFHSANEGFAGQLFFCGLDAIPVAVVPSETGKTYSFLIAGRTFEASVEIGRAVHKKGKDGGFLDVRIDGPVLPAPIKATMQLKASRSGTYSLEWHRKATV